MKDLEPKKKQLNSYIRFSGIAFQMAATIVAFVFIGKFADDYFENKKPVLTAIASLIGVIGAIFNLIRSVRKISKAEKDD